MIYGEIGLVDLSFDEMLARIDSGTQGIYHISWEAEGVRISIELTIRSGNVYYQGAVALAPIQTRFSL